MRHHSKTRRGASALIVVLVALAASAVPAAASTITVDTTEDSLAPSKCTWRDAIEAANSNAPVHHCPAGESSAIDFINFNLPPESTITLALSPPSVTGPTVIEGPGSSQLTISGGDARRVFEDSNTTIAMSGLTISHGACGEGCGIRNIAKLTLEDVVVTDNAASASGGSDIFPEAAGIENAGTLTMVDSRVTGNTTTASGATNQNGPEGGGILNGESGTLKLERSTVSGNKVIANAEGGSSTNAVGGGIVNVGTLEVIRSTISGNEASATGASGSNDAQGGGIFDSNSSGVKAKIFDSTISGNKASASGTSASSRAGGLTVEPSSTSFAVRGSTIAGNGAEVGANVTLSSIGSFASTIVAQPLGGANCSGTATSAGYNLTDGSGCGFTQLTDKTATDPLLSPAGLSDNGGPTRTIALLEGSPAIDQGLSGAGEAVDQRGLTRPVEIPGIANAPAGDGTDIGAYEVQLAPTPAPTPTPTPTPPGPESHPKPVVTIRGLPAATRRRSLKVKLFSTVPGSSFQCKLDRQGWKPCGPTFALRHLKLGRHRLSVKATAAGVTGDPVTRKFRLLAPPSRG
jgi:hypothetical protein